MIASINVLCSKSQHQEKQKALLIKYWATLETFDFGCASLRREPLGDLVFVPRLGQTWSWSIISTSGMCSQCLSQVWIYSPVFVSSEDLLNGFITSVIRKRVVLVLSSQMLVDISKNQKWIEHSRHSEGRESFIWCLTRKWENHLYIHDTFSTL